MAPTEQEFFDVLQCIDDYLGAQKMLGAALKDGLFNIARGKYTLGSELGQQRYPGDMQATALVQVTPPVNEDALYDEFKLQRVSMGQTEDIADKLASNRAAEEERTSDPSSNPPVGSQQQQHHHSTNPINWFSALPPPPVRQAQADFTTVLQQVVEAANALQRLRQHVAGLSLPDQDDAGSDAS